MNVKPVLLAVMILVAVCAAACAKENGITIETPNGSIHMSLPDAQPLPPQAPATQQASTASPVPATPAPVATATPVATAAVTPSTPTPPAATSVPATSPEGFKAKVEAKCLEKHPEGKWAYKACVVLRMGAVRKACKMAGNGKAEALCQKHEKYCTPEVQEIIQEGLAFCDALAQDGKEE